MFCRFLSFLVAMVALSSFFLVRAQDLSGNLDFFSASQVLPRGSVVYLQFSHDFSLDLQATSSSKTSPNPQASEIISQYFSFFPKISENLSRERDMKIAFADKTKGTLAAVVVSYDPQARVYQLLVNRSISHNQQKNSSITLKAFVDAHSIDENRFVSAERLANLSLVYRDQSQSIQLKPKDFARLLPIPKNNDGDLGQNDAETKNQNNNQNNNVLSPKLTEEKKKELFLKYFNWLLHSLF